MLSIRNIQAVIFDMDGTLIDNIPYHRTAWMTFLHKHKIFLEPEQFDAQHHGTLDEMIIRFFGSHIEADEIKELGQEKEKTYRDLYRNDMKEVEGLTSFLKDLRTNHIKTALATNCDTPNIEFVLNGLGISNCFDVITGGHEVVNGKPDPEIYRTTLQKLQVSEDQALVIEDSEAGIKSALKAGIQVVGITTNHNANALTGFGCNDVIDDFIHFTIIQ